MCIQMIGIDHTQASIDVRSVFSFTKANISKAMETWRETPGLLGCVMIATCNRMELWVSLQEDAQIDLFELVCSEKKCRAAEVPAVCCAAKRQGGGTAFV